MDEPDTLTTPTQPKFQTIQWTSTAGITAALDLSPPRTPYRSQTPPPTRKNEPRQVFFPISPGQNYHLGQQLQDDVVAANALDYRVTFVVADYLQRWTFKFEEEGRHDMDKTCEVMGKKWLKLSKKRRDNLKNGGTDITHWKTLLYGDAALQETQLSNEYKALLLTVTRKYTNDQSFKDLVDEMVAAYLEKRQLPKKNIQGGN